MNYNCGIYAIVNKMNNHFYIGSSENLKRRWKNHKSLLKNNHHSNIHLQHAWNKYSNANFEFLHLLYCKKEDLLKWEQFLLDKFIGTKECYNIAKNAKAPMAGMTVSDEIKAKLRESMIGAKNPFYGKHHSDEVKKIISNLHKDKTISDAQKIILVKRMSGSNNPFYGKTHTQEIYQKIFGENHPNAKLTQNDVRLIKQRLLLGFSIKEIATEFNIGRGAIYKIKNGTRWRNV